MQLWMQNENGCKMKLLRMQQWNCGCEMKLDAKWNSYGCKMKHVKTCGPIWTRYAGGGPSAGPVRCGGYLGTNLLQLMDHTLAEVGSPFLTWIWCSCAPSRGKLMRDVLPKERYCMHVFLHRVERSTSRDQRFGPKSHNRQQKFPPAVLKPPK